MRAGIPACLSYHYLRPLYRTFLEELGVDVVDSGRTTQGDLGCLSLCPTDEPCISVKVAFAHARRLLEAGVQTLFVPAVVSISDTAYCCPKMMALPAMLRSGLCLEPHQLVSPVIDMKDNPKTWRKSWVKAAWALGVGSEVQAMRALDAGIDAWRQSERDAVTDIYPVAGEQITAVMGHAYVLDDVFAEKITGLARKCGQVVLPRMVSPSDAIRELGSLFDGRKMWTIEGQILGASMHLLRKSLVDRLVLVSAFSCGPSSIIENYIQKEAEDRGIPFLNLAVDEHTGEAGLLTRMEAFLDTPKRAKISRPAYAPAATKPCADDGPVGLVSLGNIHIPLETLLIGMGAKIAKAPPITDELVAIGKELCPEFICYPMVTIIGQIAVHARQGVRKVIMIQGKGKCRLGWYAQIMQEILDKNGMEVKIHAIDSPFPLREKGKATMEFVRSVAGKVDASRIARALELTFIKLELIDSAYDRLRELRAFEEERGAADKLFAVFKRDMEKADGFMDVIHAYRRFSVHARRIPVADTDPLHVSLVGEVYVVNEPFVNKEVEKMMGSLDRRVRVHRKLDVSSWVNYHLFKTPRAVRDYREVTEMADPYLPLSVGGHGQESGGEVVLAKKHGHDGVLHLFPFTCMPEIIAQNVLVKASSDLDIPVLSLMISEQTGVAGLATRIEAFCDLLDGRRRGNRRDAAVR